MRVRHAIVATACAVLSGCGATQSAPSSDVRRTPAVLAASATRPSEPGAASAPPALPPADAGGDPAALSPENSSETTEAPHCIEPPACKDQTPAVKFDAHTESLVSKLVDLQREAARIEPRTSYFAAENRRLFRSMKALTREILERTLRGVQPAVLDCECSISPAIATALSARGVRMAGDGDGGVGTLAGPAIQHGGPPGKWIATWMLQLPCDGEGSVYVFERRGDAVALTLALENDDYKDIADAQGFPDARLSPADPKGKSFLVVNYVSPQCQSAWHRSTTVAVEPSGSPLSPRRLFSSVASTFVLDGGGALEATQSGFTIRYPGSGMIGRPERRLHVESYVRDGTGFRRVQPYALEAADYPDEWLRLDWAQAASLTARERRAELRKWHVRLRAAQSTPREVFRFESMDGPDGQGSARVHFVCAACSTLPDDFTMRLVRDGAGYLIDGVEEGP